MNAHKLKKDVVKEYDAKLDSKKRITIRGSKYEHYRVQIKKDGTLILKPQILVDLGSISENTLKMIESSIKSLKEGIASEPIDLSKYNFDEED